MAKKTQKLDLPLYDALTHFDNSLEGQTIDYRVPDYIYANMKHRFRNYQDEAFRYYHYALTFDQFTYLQDKHVLFNMATGSGKTDLMAGLILYLYQEHGYQRFLFTVNTKSVLKKTFDNLTNPSSGKYLYRYPLEIEGERVVIQAVKQFPRMLDKNRIYLKLDTIQGIASDLFTQKENTMGLTEYETLPTVILADEAHHYSASTKREKEDEKSWERIIDLILNAHEKSRLLEFTATMELDNKNVYQKYKDKVIYRYALDRFIYDGYSKNIRRIQSSNTDLDNMMNVILLSEFRRRYAREFHDTRIKPVILFKSPRIADSNEAEEKFNQLVESLTAETVEDFCRMRYKDDGDNEELSETLQRTYAYYLANIDDLDAIVREMKRQFAPTRIINANDSDRGNILDKGPYEALNSLESPNNLFRVIFAVAKLTEGWDVLNLYDIVRISDTEAAKGTKNATTSEAQLIGRGARYNPFELNENIAYKRRFEDGGRDSLLLETLHYHTINEPQYLKNLVASLDDMNLPTGEDTKNPLLDYKVKPAFKRTSMWKEGNIYYNERVAVEDQHYDDLSKYGIKNDNHDDIIVEWKLGSHEYSYETRAFKKDYTDTVQKVVKYDERYILKAMERNSFFHFDNLRKYLPLLRSRKDFLGDRWLNLSNRTMYAIVPKYYETNSLSPTDRLEIIEIYLQEVARKIQSGYRKGIGTNKFIAYPIREYIADYRKRSPNYDTGNAWTNQRLPQYVSRKDYSKDDFFVYDSALMNQTEHQLVGRIRERVEELSKVYHTIYLIRMDENMHRESAKNDQLKLYQFDSEADEVRFEAFQPDFLLLLENEEYFLQIFIEPKGLTMEQDQWKEDVLTYINEHEDELRFEGDLENVRIKGLKFYTMNDDRGTINQLGEIALGRPFEPLSYSLFVADSEKEK